MHRPGSVLEAGRRAGDDGARAPFGPPRRGTRFGLRTRIAVFFAGLLLVVNVVVLVTQRGPIVRVFERNFRIRGEELALNLAARARLTDARSGSLRDLVETFREFDDVQGATILLRNGEVLAAAPEQERVSAPAAVPEPGAVLVRETSGGCDFFAAVPGAEATACVRLSSRVLSDTIRRTGLTIGVIAAAAVGAGFLLVFAGAGIFTRPVQRLADLARRIRAGELGAGLELRRADEIGELSAAMNAMSVELAEKDRGLRGAKETLEAQNQALRSQRRELETQTRNLETLVASLAEGVLFLDLDRRVVIANSSAERVLRMPASRPAGFGLEDLRPEDGNSPLTALLAEACDRASRSDSYHSQIPLADHLHTVTTVQAPEGGVLGVLAVMQDLSKIRALETEQKELLDQLYQQEKMAIVGLLAASLAHELNTPLGTILLHTQRVAREMEEGEQAQALGAVEREVLRCREIVRRLLDFSRFAEGRPQRIDPRAPVERSVSIAEAGLRQKGISIRTVTAADVPAVEADPNQIEQVLMNLIWNAADAMPEGGPIEIRLRRDGDGAEIRVRDKGKGIPAEHRERVFEPFFTTKPPGKGTGLGLAICRRIVEEHGGTIGIHSAEGGGTEVRVHLPGARA